jgi:MFS superfamily sulfate permease-like transporter
MEFLLGVLVGMVIAFFYWQSVIVKAINKVVNEVVTTAESTFKKLVVTVEQEGDQFLLYQTDNNRFLMQGTSLADFQKQLPLLNVDALSIANGDSTAAQALLKASQHNKESHEDSNNK